MKSTKRLLVFDSHPVQNRTPIWQSIEKLIPAQVHVVFASDCSIRGYTDEEFGKTFAWDEPLLSGYNYTILNCEKGKPLSGWKSLTGRGVKKLIKQMKPDVILLTGLNYRYDLMAYVHGFISGIPLWLRCETQDQAQKQSLFKIVIRFIIYWMAYSGIDKFFFIGELNKKHYLRHGVNSKKLKPAFYGTVNHFEHLTDSEKEYFRHQQRLASKIPSSGIVVGFSGKFIKKKNPEILFEMLAHIPLRLRQRIHLYFMGSGELEINLRELADKAFQKFGVKSFFAGFVNQSKIAAHYLAMDILVLPSLRKGETWGLVANEAMQAGCGVIVSDAVGCGVDFQAWERFKIFTQGMPADLADRVNDLTVFYRDFNWATEKLKQYSIEAATNAFVTELNSYRKI